MVLVTDLGLKGDGMPENREAFIAAVAALSPGETLDFGYRTYLFNTYSATEVLLFPQYVHVAGSNARILIDPSVPATVDALRIVVQHNEKGRRIHGITLAPASGSPARCGINFDLSATGRAAFCGVLADVIVGGDAGAFGGPALRATITDPTGMQQSFYNVSHRHCWFVGGIDYSQYVGDTLGFCDETIISGPGSVVVSQAPGAGMVRFDHCALTNDGGLRFLSCDWPVVRDCEFEQEAPTTHPLAALVSIEGVPNAHNCATALLTHNSFTPRTNCGIVTPIYVNASERATIEHNRIAAGSGGHIFCDTYASDVAIEDNDYYDASGRRSGAQIVNHGTYAPSTHMQRLFTYRGLNATVAGLTAIAAPTTQSALVIDHAVIRPAAFDGTGKTTQAVLSIGARYPYQTPLFYQLVSGQTVPCDNLRSVNRVVPMPASYTQVLRTMQVELLITTPSNAAVETWDIDFWGYYMPQAA